MKRALVFVLLAACGGSGDDSQHSSADAGRTSMGGGDDDGSNQGSGSNNGSGELSGLTSTLTSSCATLQGRAIVNYNGNLGIAITEDNSPYSFVGSIQFQLPDGFSGNVPNPENWDGNDTADRKIVAVTSQDYDLHGNHCWNGATPGSGSVSITTWLPEQGIVKATFNAFPMHSCTGAEVCTVTGTIETTADGVFD
ncbi:MAG: hypothetical protein QM831_33565 [Kofleriaceae bacterium]